VSACAAPRRRQATVLKCSRTRRAGRWRSSSRRTEIGYLPQDGLTHAGRTLFEEASSAFSAARHERRCTTSSTGSATRRSAGRARRMLRATRAAGSLPHGRGLQHGPAGCDGPPRPRSPDDARVRRDVFRRGGDAIASPSCSSAAQLLLLDERKPPGSRGAQLAQEYLGPTRRGHPRLDDRYFPRFRRHPHHRLHLRSTERRQLQPVRRAAHAMLERLRQAKKGRRGNRRRQMFIDRCAPGTKARRCRAASSC